MISDEESWYNYLFNECEMEYFSSILWLRVNYRFFWNAETWIKKKIF